MSPLFLFVICLILFFPYFKYQMNIFNTLILICIDGLFLFYIYSVHRYYKELSLHVELNNIYIKEKSDEIKLLNKCTLKDDFLFCEDLIVFVGYKVSKFNIGQVNIPKESMGLKCFVDSVKKIGIFHPLFLIVSLIIYIILTAISFDI